MNTLYMDVVNKIKEKIKEKRISQRQLAKMINVSQVTVNSMLAQKTGIKVDVLQKIADVLNVPICYFFKRNYDDDDLLNVFKKLISFDVEYVKGVSDFANRDRTKKVPHEVMLEKITDALTNSGRTLKYDKLTDKELKLLLENKYISEEFLSYIIDMLYDDE